MPDTPAPIVNPSVRLRRTSPVAIPDDLRALAASASVQIIMVGDQPYNMTPLTEGEVEDLIVDVTKTFGRVMEALSTRVKATEDGSQPSTGSEMVEESINAAVRSGLVVRIVSKVTGVPEEQLRAEMTVPQILHAASVVWQQNFDVASYPKAVQGKVKGLLTSLGIGRKSPDAVCVDEILALTFDPTVTDRAELTKGIIRCAAKYLSPERLSRLSLPPSVSLRSTFAEAAEKSAEDSPPPAAPTSAPSRSADSRGASGTSENKMGA